jgi:signal transduction histidine kinase
MLDPFDPLIIAQSLLKTNDWKSSLDALIKSVRAGFIFDNMALYRAEPDSRLSEIVYARAVGRGQRAEADAAWGEIIANQVMASNQMVLQQPETFDPQGDRLAQACLLALPLRIPEKLLGVLIFIRFGGPVFSEEQLRQAEFVASQVSFLLERQTLLTELSQLEDARRTMQLQQDFISTVSHELRTPLGFIKGYSTTLLRNDTTWDSATQREFLTIIDEEADHLARLIENVLESARLQSNTLPMDFQPIRIDTIIRDVAMRVQSRYKDLELKTELPAVFVHADTVRLAQVFENLISNAVKYAPGSPVLVRANQENDNLHIKVKDKGPGIAPEHLSFLFDRFYRVPGETASGTGLGLFICKQIIQAHHGNIWVESTVGEGSTFHVVLPIRQQIIKEETL